MIYLVLGLSFTTILTLALSFYIFNHGSRFQRDIFLPASIFIIFFRPMLLIFPKAHFKISQLTALPLTPFIMILTIILAAVFFSRIRENDQNVFSVISLKSLLLPALIIDNFAHIWIMLGEVNNIKIISQVFLYSMTNVFAVASFAYLSYFAGVTRKDFIQMVKSLFYTVTIAIIVGSIVYHNIAVFFGLCIAAGMQTFVAIFVGLPILFSNGESPTQDKLRYFSACCALLLTILYYPLCLFLRV